jgi:hypothetical protein
MKAGKARKAWGAGRMLGKGLCDEAGGVFIEVTSSMKWKLV